MSIINNPTNPAHAGRPSDDLDGLLRAFYRSEVPDPWPVLKPPAEPTSRSGYSGPRRWPLQSSRWVLAASVALLLIGQLFLSARFSESSSSKSEGEFRPPFADRNSIKFRSYKVEIEEEVSPEGKILPRVKSLTIRAEREPGR
jgi:hypothetical protein